MSHDESKAAAFLSSCIELPEDGLAADEDRTPYYRPWGFTIYRTCYSTSSDEKWEQLLTALREKTRERLAEMEGMTDEIFEKTWSLFRLNAREDKTTLKGLNIDELREVYKEGEVLSEPDPRVLSRTLTSMHAHPPMNALNSPRQRRVFLLADEKVLNSVETPDWKVKAVEVDYNNEEHDVEKWRNTRAGPPTYFGWMELGVGELLVLWRGLGEVGLRECQGQKEEGLGEWV